MIRKSNFELLRIVSILMIIGLHYFNGSMGGTLKYVIPGEFNYYFSYFFESMFIIGVNLFILTTGYFNHRKKSIHLGKLFRLIGQAYFYGFIFYLLNILFSYDTFNLIKFILAINPFLSGGYWFIKYYVILNLLSPFINIMIDHLDKNLLTKLIGILLLLFSVWPTFLPQAPITNGGYGLMNFILLYIVGVYIRRYGVFNQSKLVYFLLYLGCGSITYLFSLLRWSSSWNYDFIFNIIGSVCLFILFSKLEIQSKKVNYLSTFTFSVYLIHFSPFMINFIYHDILKCADYYNSPWLALHFFISIITIYICCIGIELICRLLIKVIGIIYLFFVKVNSRGWLLNKINKLLELNFEVQ